MSDSLPRLTLFGPAVRRVAPRRPAPDRAADSSFVQGVRDFDALGRRTAERTEGGITYLVNEFWTSGQRRAHSIPEIGYRAGFKPQLPRFFVERLTVPGDRVHDPFMGRGTTPVEAALLGRRPAGNDVNPLSVLLTRLRLRPVSVSRVAEALDGVDWFSGEIENPELSVFYSERTLRQIGALRRWLFRNGPPDRAPAPEDDWISMVALTCLTGH